YATWGTACRSREQAVDVALDPSQNLLGLWVGEPSVELQCLDAARAQHQAGIEAAAVRGALVPQSLHDRHQHGGHRPLDGVRAKEGDRRVPAHPTGIRSSVAVEGASVVTCRW